MAACLLVSSIGVCGGGCDAEAPERGEIAKATVSNPRLFGRLNRCRVRVMLENLKQYENVSDLVGIPSDRMEIGGNPRLSYVVRLDPRIPLFRIDSAS